MDVLSFCNASMLWGVAWVSTFCTCLLLYDCVIDVLLDCLTYCLPAHAFFVPVCFVLSVFFFLCALPCLFCCLSVYMYLSVACFVGCSFLVFITLLKIKRRSWWLLAFCFSAWLCSWLFDCFRYCLLVHPIVCLFAWFLTLSKTKRKPLWSFSFSF